MDDASKKVVEALSGIKLRRRAAAVAKEKFKDVDEESSPRKRGARNDTDDSDDDPDFDHEEALKEKKRKKDSRESLVSSPARRGRGRGAGGGIGASGSVSGGNSTWGPGVRKRPLGSSVKCPFCDERFNSVAIVEDHLMATHENERRYSCAICPAPERAFPFFNNAEDHMTKEHSHQWSRRDKFDPLRTKALPRSVKQASRFCVVPEENPAYREDMPKPRVPRSYGTVTRAAAEKPAKILCPRHPKCSQFFYNDDPRVVVDHVMSEHLKLHRYHCHRCGPEIKYNTLNEFHAHLKEKHKVTNPSYLDAATDVYLVCQRVPDEVVKQLGLTPDDVEAIENMGKGCEDELEEEEDHDDDDDDALVVDQKWDVYIKGCRLFFRCRDCKVDVQGRTGVMEHNREKHGVGSKVMETDS